MTGRATVSAGERWWSISKGNVVAESFQGREELLVADLDPDLINMIRRKESGSMRYSFYLEGRRPELYGELVERKL